MLAGFPTRESGWLHRVPAIRWRADRRRSETDESLLGRGLVFVSATNSARSISLVYRCTRSMAATMSSMRTRQSLGGTDRLCENASAELALDGVLHDQVDRSAENALQLALHAEELEQPDGTVEFDQEIHVAARTGFTSRDGAKKLQGADAEVIELGSVARKPLTDLFPRHDLEATTARRLSRAAATLRYRLV